MAYVPPYELTKMDIAALKQASYIVAWLDSHGVDGPRFEAVKRAEKTEKDPFATDIRHEIAAPITIIKGYTNRENYFACCTSVSLYPQHACEASSALATLRIGDAIALQFYPDAKTNENLRELNLHGDAFNLLVYRKGKHFATFNLETSTGPNNSARMCRLGLKQYRLA